MLTNQGIDQRLDDLSSAKEKLTGAKDAIVETAKRRPQPDTTLAKDVEHFTEAFDHYERLMFDVLDAVHDRIKEPLPRPSAL
jgi:hypothetical protein